MLSVLHVPSTVTCSSCLSCVASLLPTAANLLPFAIKIHIYDCPPPPQMLLSFSVYEPALTPDLVSTSWEILLLQILPCRQPSVIQLF